MTAFLVALFISALAVLLVLVALALLIGMVDPRDRPAARLSLGAVFAVMLVLGGRACPTRWPRRGSGCRLGPCGWTRSPAGSCSLVVLLVPLVLALAASLTFRYLRRGSHSEAALLAFMAVTCLV